MIKSLNDWNRYLMYVEDLIQDAININDANALIRLNLVHHMAKNEIIRLQALNNLLHMEVAA